MTDREQRGIELEQRGDVWVLHMRNDENRFNRPSVEALHAALDEVDAVEGPAALVTTGEGKFFSNGLDLDWLMAGGEGTEGFIDEVHRLLGRVLGFGGRHRRRGQRPRLRRRRHARRGPRLRGHARGPRLLVPARGRPRPAADAGHVRRGRGPRAAAGAARLVPDGPPLQRPRGPRRRHRRRGRRRGRRARPGGGPRRRAGRQEPRRHPRAQAPHVRRRHRHLRRRSSPSRSLRNLCTDRHMSWIRAQISSRGRGMAGQARDGPTNS